MYGLCKVDGHIQKVGNFRIEPPGLFRGRGDHPKQGKVGRIGTLKFFIDLSFRNFSSPASSYGGFQLL